MNCILNDLRDCNNILGNTFHLTIAETNIWELLTSTIDNFFHHLQSRNLKISTEVSPQIEEEVYLDGNRVG
jgi:hypothetical protein